MRRAVALAILVQHREELRRSGVRSLAIFGSVARDQAGPESDVDILVEFDRPGGLFDFVNLKLQLEDWLGRRVDLVEPEGLRPEFRDDVRREAVHAA